MKLKLDKIKDMHKPISKTDIIEHKRKIEDMAKRLEEVKKLEKEKQLR